MKIQLSVLLSSKLFETMLFVLISLTITALWCGEAVNLDDYSNQEINLDDYSNQEINVIIYLNVEAFTKDILRTDQHTNQAINESIACSCILDSITKYKNIRQTSECYLNQKSGSWNLEMELILVFPSIALFLDRIEDADYGELISQNLNESGIKVKQLTVLQEGFLIQEGFSETSVIQIFGPIQSKDYILSKDGGKVGGNGNNESDENDFSNWNRFQYYFDGADNDAVIHIDPTLKHKFVREACNQTMSMLIAGAKEMQDILEGCWTSIVPGSKGDIPVQYLFLSVEDMIYKGLFSMEQSLTNTTYNIMSNGSNSYPKKIFKIQSTQVLIDTVSLMYVRKPDFDFPGSPFDTEDY